MYQCKNLAHLPNENMTSADRQWMSYFEGDVDQHVTLLPLNNSIELVSQRHPYRLCVTSFSPSALKKAEFVGRELQRPMKIHLDLNNDYSVPIEFWYKHNGTDFDSAVLVSIRAASYRKFHINNLTLI